MDPTSRRTWTDSDYEDMSWHDNHIHGFHVAQGAYGAGTLSFDIDYILAWVKGAAGEIVFEIAPTTLAFHEVTNLELAIDYATPKAALFPFSVDSIARSYENRETHTATMWRIQINWPVGFVTFEASGFKQELRAEPIRCSQQFLSAEERGDA